MSPLEQLPQPQPKTALEIVLEWSQDRPAWQRDALRRIVQAQKLTETYIAELVTLCKQGRTENPPASDPQPQPLEAGHLPANPGVRASISLTAIKNVSAVNNLAPDQTLSFAQPESRPCTETTQQENPGMRASSSALAVPVIQK